VYRDLVKRYRNRRDKRAFSWSGVCWLGHKESVPGTLALSAADALR